MAPKAMKRPAAGKVDRPAKKPATNAAEGKCAEIAAELQAAGLPTQSVADMLAKVINSTLGVYKADRHDHQEGIVKMMGEALGMIEESKKEKLSAAQAKVAGAATEKEAREKAKTDATASLEEVTKAVEEAKATVDDCKAKQKDATSDLKQAEEDKEDGEETLSRAKGDKEKLDACKDSLGDAALDAAKVKGYIKIFRQFGFSSGLLDVLPEILQKMPGDRSTFEGIVMKQLDEEFTAKITEFETEITTEENSTAGRGDAVDAAKKALEATSEAFVQASAKLQEATVAEKAAAAAQIAAETAVASYESDMAAVEVEASSAQEELTKFVEGPLAAYKSLLDFAPPPPEPEEPEAQEETAPAETETSAAAPAGEVAAAAAAA